MKDHVTLTITSLLSMLLFSLHWADEVARGIEPGGLSGIFGVLILVVWLYAVLALAERRAGYVVTLVASLGGVGVLVLHMSGRGMVGGRIAANSSGALFWVWTLIALGVTAAVSFVLSARGLWHLRGRGR
jgi:hypothetical protein